ncbi:PIN domain-containing protein [Candidatus Daviesbacteria bacterium]|nr:PIN domain-containing protein [Candidatus Daviesbacteria bacterium]MBI4038475.1 PIN domain-containing protein [Candidatus Daviesbacteria bacterium]
MKKIFIDTNLWVRFFIEDNHEQFDQTKTLLAQVEEGNLRAYTSTIVLLELQFVLQKLYFLSFEKAVEIFEIIRKVRNITIIEKTNLDLAIKFFRLYKIKFPDCLIASQLPKDIILVSFDEELVKIKEITLKKPKQIIKGN